MFWLTAFLFTFIDMVIDPVALRGDRWFLGKIYYYPDPGWHFGIPYANYIGWTIVGCISLAIYFPVERRLTTLSSAASVTPRLLLGVGLYYGVLVIPSYSIHYTKLYACLRPGSRSRAPATRR